MIRHAAIFRLKHRAGSAEEATFLEALAALSVIPGVQDFQIWRETSPKNDFDFAVSMTFVDGSTYQGYNDHPDHVAFVQGSWIPEVSAFMEHDTVALTL
jgi:heme-degrading monooxygenase HmoA